MTPEEDPRIGADGQFQVRVGDAFLKLDAIKGKNELVLSIDLLLLEQNGHYGTLKSFLNDAYAAMNLVGVAATYPTPQHVPPAPSQTPDTDAPQPEPAPKPPAKPAKPPKKKPAVKKATRKSR